MIRAKELAARLGVSPATISLVLNDKPGICEETRQELRRKICEMGYGYMLKNPQGSEAVHEAGGAIAFVIYPVCKECSDIFSFYAAVMEGASAYLQEQGYEMLIFHVKPECGCSLEKCLADKNVKGLIVQKPCLESIDLQELKAMEKPFVMLDTYYMDEEVNSVSVNNEQGVYKLIRHLQEQGHERIGYISCSAQRASFCERKGYYHMILAQLGLPQQPQWCLEVSDAEGIHRLLQSENAPTAFLTDNDMVAWKAIQQLQASGHTVPQQIAVVGFEDREIAAMVNPPLTTIRVPDMALGRHAAQLLLSTIQESDSKAEECIKMELGVELVVRDSTRRE
ncbi:MAG: LacI family transcriptional regulator [Lachnospiraceae bacterium]|jgi:LacI family transcriptional regulator|nr:LacI family transcriptional regulator [Lachnospiraceae bacterium]